MSEARARRFTAVALAAIGYGAVGIAALGFLSLATDRDVIGGEGIGQAPGAAGYAASVLAVVLTSWSAVRREPSYPAAFFAAPAAVVAYAAGLWLVAVIGGTDPLEAASIAGAFVLSWNGLILALAAVASSLTAVALVRTAARPPRWRWEQDGE